MIRDITLGQYYQADSVIHRLDPRVKLMATLVYIVSLFLTENFIAYGIAALFLIVMIVLSKVPFRFMIRGMKPILFLMLLTVLINLFTATGEKLVSFWVFTITVEGVKRAVLMVFRLSFLVIGSSIMTLTTTPNHLTDGLEKGLGFLRVIRVPVHEIAMMMSIALRFIPILVEETDKIMKAQQARGADFESGGIIKKAKAMVPLLVPLFISAIRRAYDLATAMEAKCYRGGAGRTKMKPLKYTRRDALAYTVIFAYFFVMIIVKVYVV